MEAQSFNEDLQELASFLARTPFSDSYQSIILAAASAKAVDEIRDLAEKLQHAEAVLLKTEKLKNEQEKFFGNLARKRIRKNRSSGKGVLERRNDERFFQIVLEKRNGDSQREGRFEIIVVGSKLVRSRGKFKNSRIIRLKIQSLGYVDLSYSKSHSKRFQINVSSFNKWVHRGATIQPDVRSILEEADAQKELKVKKDNQDQQARKKILKGTSRG